METTGWEVVITSVFHEVTTLGTLAVDSNVFVVSPVLVIVSVSVCSAFLVITITVGMVTTSDLVYGEDSVFVTTPVFDLTSVMVLYAVDCL